MTGRDNRRSPARSAGGGALARLAEVESRAGQFDQAIEAAHRWVALDPLSEGAHRELCGLHVDR